MPGVSLQPRPQTHWTLQDRWRTVRLTRWCSRCRREIDIGDLARYQVFVTTDAREFLHGYSCWGCNEGRR